MNKTEIVLIHKNFNVCVIDLPVTTPEPADLLGLPFCNEDIISVD